MSERERDETVPEDDEEKRGKVKPSGRSPNDIGMTARSDVSREGLGTTEPGGRGAVAFGGRGDVGAEPGGLGGKGRGSEGGAFDSSGGQTGGLGGEGRGSEGIARGGAASADSTANIHTSSAPQQKGGMTPRRGPMPDPSAEMGDVSLAGGAGDLNAEDALVDSGIREQGGVGRESQSTAGEEGGANRSGTAGDDRPARDQERGAA